MHKLLAIPMLLVLGACGGGGSSGSTMPPPPHDASPGGIWTAQWVEAAGPNAGDQINLKALVTEDGDFYYAGYNAVNGCATVGFGQLAVNGSAVSGTTSNAIVTFTTVSGVNTNCAYPDGSTYGTGTVSGTVTERSSMMLTAGATTSMGTALPAETHSWSYSTLYAAASSYATIAGNYADGGNTLTISGNGVMFEQDPASGCVLNGQVSIINSTWNAYGISFTFSNCAGQNAALNGLSASGLGYFDNSVNPNQVILGAKMVYMGQTLVILGSLTKM